MFQDITPHKFHNEFARKSPVDTDYVLIAKDNQYLLEDSSGIPEIPRYYMVAQCFPAAAENVLYLFSIDDAAFYLSMQEVTETDRFHYYSMQIFKDMEPAWLAFAGATAAHLTHWYSTHQYCGRCAAVLKQSKTERALQCPACGIIEYPKISPVVIVGITDGDRILMTKYANAGYKKYALVAGFTEIGETLEDTIRREVMEEVGLRVKNIRYYKSQPWAFSESILAGFFADVHGAEDVTLDYDELSEAAWFSRDEIPREDSTFSLTWDMIETFRNNEV